MAASGETLSRPAPKEREGGGAEGCAVRKSFVHVHKIQDSPTLSFVFTTLFIQACVRAGQPSFVTSLGSQCQGSLRNRSRRICWDQLLRPLLERVAQKCQAEVEKDSNDNNHLYSERYLHYESSREPVGIVAQTCCGSVSLKHIVTDCGVWPMSDFICIIRMKAGLHASHVCTLSFIVT